MAARFCDMACKCQDCKHYRKDRDRGGKACYAKPDKFGNIHAERKAKDKQ